MSLTIDRGPPPVGVGVQKGSPLGRNENKLYYLLDLLVSLIGVKLLDKEIDINMVCLHFSNAVIFFLHNLLYEIDEVG